MDEVLHPAAAQPPTAPTSTTDLKEPPLTTNIHAGPGGQAAVTYQVIEGRLIEGSSEYHAATVGRSDDGIHLMLTTEAAAALATILIEHPVLQHATDELVPLEEETLAAASPPFDDDLWAHVAIDLIAARALARSAGVLGQNVVYAATYGSSGYLPPRPKLRRVAAGDELEAAVRAAAGVVDLEQQL